MNIADMIAQAYEDGYEAGLADGKPKWIPVAVKMPPPCTYDQHETGWVLVLSPGGCIDIANYCGYTGMWHGEFEVYDNVIAWMPLPEPPKEETP